MRMLLPMRCDPAVVVAQPAIPDQLQRSCPRLGGYNNGLRE
jgi:hypothetical protein